MIDERMCRIRCCEQFLFDCVFYVIQRASLRAAKNTVFAFSFDSSLKAPDYPH